MSEDAPAPSGKILFLDPSKIIVDPELTGRAAPPDPKRVSAMAASILAAGQLQPIRVRKTGKGEYTLAFGNTRLAAANEILASDANFKVQAQLLDGNEEDAFVANVRENKDRGQTSPVDDANNVRIMKEKYGKSDEEIALIMGCSKPWLRVLRGVLRAPKKVQKLVASGDIAARSAVEIADMKPKAQERALEKIDSIQDTFQAKLAAVTAPAEDAVPLNAAMGKKKKVKKGQARAEKSVKAKKRKAIKKAITEAVETPVVAERTGKQIALFWNDVANTEKDENVIAFAKANRKFARGKSTEADLAAALNAFLLAVGVIESTETLQAAAAAD